MPSERNLTTTRSQVFGDVDAGTECRVCGRDVDDGRAKHCSRYCRRIVESVMRMLNWTGVRRVVIERDDRTCQQCGFDQDWLDRGYGHLREMVEDELPERPESPSMQRLGEGVVSDDELDAHREAFDEWCERKRELIRRIYRKENWSSVAFPTPDNRLEVDHITRITDGGHPFDPANLQTLCEDCHEAKTADENSEQKAERPDVERQLLDFVTNGGESA